MKNLRNSGRFEMNKKGNIFLAHNRSYIIAKFATTAPDGKHISAIIM